MSTYPGHFHGFMPSVTPEMVTQQNPQLQKDGAGNAPVEDGVHQVVIADEEADAPMRAIRNLLRK